MSSASINIIFQAWHNAVHGKVGFNSASDLAECWLDKGGDINLQLRRFINRESVLIAFNVINPATALSRQFRLLLIILYLGGKYSFVEHSKYDALKMFIHLYVPGSCIIEQENTISYESFLKAVISFKKRKNILDLMHIFRSYQSTRYLALQLHNLYVLNLFEDKPNSKYF